MPKKKETGGRPAAANARTAIVLEIMDDMALILPPESMSKEGFDIIDHPYALKELWKVANDFVPISAGTSHRRAREQFYARFRQAIKTKGAFRKNTAANNKIWARIQTNLHRLEATN